MPIHIATICDVREAEAVIREHVSPAPLIRSTALEKELGLPQSRRVWLKDYGWTPSGSFKLLGALNWMANHLELIGSRPVAAHSSGNFASGIAFAGMRYGKRVIIVMPENAPRVKFDLTRSFGAEIRTYDVGEHNWPILKQRVTQAACIPDLETQRAKRWIYLNHDLRTEPSGAIAALLLGKVNIAGEGDLVVVISGRNVDDNRFQEWIACP